MNEESQLEEMRAAVRGDRERAERARRRSLENVHVFAGPPPSPEEAQPEPPARRGLRRLFRRR